MGGRAGSCGVPDVVAVAVTCGEAQDTISNASTADGHAEQDTICKIEYEAVNRAGIVWNRSSCQYGLRG